jgi:hypothetical protein
VSLTCTAITSLNKNPNNKIQIPKNHVISLEFIFYVLGFKYFNCNQKWLQFFIVTQGTGSEPCPPQGWHLEILLMVNHKPFNGPYFLKASIA